MMRVGTVPFLVARPLSWGLDLHPQVELTVAPPAQLAEALRAGELDVALASSVISLDEGPLQFWHAGPVIASRGPVRSVIVLLRPGCAPHQVRRLALDPASRSGRALAQVLLREFWQAEYLAETCRPEAALANGEFDAVQIIGDRAIQLAGQYEDWHLLDLGQAWSDWTDLPFVFAGWITREGFAIEEAAHILRAASVSGLEQRADLLPEGMRLLERDADFVRRYLFDDLVYSLHEADVRAALQKFAAHVHPIAS